MSQASSLAARVKEKSVIASCGQAKLLTISVFLGLTGIVLLMRAGTLGVGPTWDAAMSTWPASFELSQTWDVPNLLSLPSYPEGGPNTHALSLMTFVQAALIAWLNPPTVFLLIHLVNIGLLAGIGTLIYFSMRGVIGNVSAISAAGAVVLFPIMVGQSAYLYTELPSTFFAFLGLVLAVRRKNALSAVSLSIAILVKPLAVAAVLPAMLGLALAKRRRSKSVSPLLALIALVPSLVFEPQPLAEGATLGAKLSFVYSASWHFLWASPELLLALAIPFLSFLTWRRRVFSHEESIWFWVASTHLLTFVLLFLTNALVTPGRIFIPRYFVQVVPSLTVLLAIALHKRDMRVRMAVWTLVLVFSVSVVRGPFALGGDNPSQPIAERSLAFVELHDEYLDGVSRLGMLAGEIPIFYEHLVHYIFAYPQLGYSGPRRQNGTATSLLPDWGDDLSELPDRFAMMIGYPWLGGDRMSWVREKATGDSAYSVSIERIGDARVFPLEIVTVERQSG